MVVERFKDAPAIYQRLSERGRIMPDTLKYVSSWISEDRTTCYQLLEAENVADFATWTSNWSDLMEFEITPVRTSAEMIALMRDQERG